MSLRDLICRVTNGSCSDLSGLTVGGGVAVNTGATSARISFRLVSLRCL